MDWRIAFLCRKLNDFWKDSSILLHRGVNLFMDSKRGKTETWARNFPWIAWYLFGYHPLLWCRRPKCLFHSACTARKYPQLLLLAFFLGKAFLLHFLLLNHSRVIRLSKKKKKPCPFPVSTYWYVTVEKSLAEKILTKTPGTHLGVSLLLMISFCFLPQYFLPRSKWQCGLSVKVRVPTLISLETAGGGGEGQEKLMLFSLFPLGFFPNI